MGLDRADAYALLHNYLYVLKLPEGVINLEANIPSRNLNLVALTTQLVARSDMHPALINLLLMAAKEVHKTGGEFEPDGEFPTPKYLDFNLNSDAEQFYKFGPPFLQCYLPFWIAILLSRIIIFLLPVVAVVLPFFQIMPLTYSWLGDAKKAEKPNLINWASCALILLDLKIILHRVFSSIHSLP